MSEPIYLIWKDDKETGPFTVEDLLDRHALTPETPIRRQDSEEWVKWEDFTKQPGVLEIIQRRLPSKKKESTHARLRARDSLRRKTGYPLLRSLGPILLGAETAAALVLWIMALLSQGDPIWLPLFFVLATLATLTLPLLVLLGLMGDMVADLADQALLDKEK